MRKPSSRAKVSIKNIGRFIQGYTRMFTEAFGLLETHKKEQVVWRSHEAKECTANGSCLFCGCSTPAKYYSDEACEDPNRKCYPAMMSEASWEQYKKSNNITVDIS